MRNHIVAIVGGVLLTLTAQSQGNDTPVVPQLIQSLVPGGKVLRQDKDEFDIETPQKTIVEIELHNDGSLEEASGDLAHKGDVFNPGNGHITLATAVKNLEKAGKSPTGDWSFESKLLGGWVYEIEGMDNNQRMEYKIDAKNGKIISEKRD